MWKKVYKLIEAQKAMKNSMDGDSLDDEKQFSESVEVSEVDENTDTLLYKANIYIKENPEEWAKRKEDKKVYADRKVGIYKVHPIILEMHAMRDLRINEKHREWKESNNRKFAHFVFDLMFKKSKTALKDQSKASTSSKKKFPALHRRKSSESSAELNQPKPSEQGITSPNVYDVSVKIKSVVLSNKDFDTKKLKNFKEVKVILSLHPDNKRQSTNYLAVHDHRCMVHREFHFRGVTDCKNKHILIEVKGRVKLSSHPVLIGNCCVAGVNATIQTKKQVTRLPLPDEKNVWLSASSNIGKPVSATMKMNTKTNEHKSNEDTLSISSQDTGQV